MATALLKDRSMRHPTACLLCGALLWALAVVSMQGCKRADMVTQRSDASAAPAVYLEDSVLASRVRAALSRSPVVDSFNIRVESHDGTVLLSGMASDPTQIDLAMFVAQSVPGVGSVDSFMFSTGAAPAVAMERRHRSDRSAWDVRQPSGDAPVQDASPARRPDEQRLGPTDERTSLGLPLLQGNGPPPTQGAPEPSRWVSIAHRVLGIHSIQEELLIKQ
jgi:hypothetical protein